MLNYEGLKLPKFMHDMDEYMRCLDVIAETNHIDALECPELTHASSEKDGETKILGSTINADTFKKSLIIEDSDEVNDLTGGKEERKEELIGEMAATGAEVTLEPSSNFSSRMPSLCEESLLLLENNGSLVESASTGVPGGTNLNNQILKYFNKDFIGETPPIKSVTVKDIDQRKKII